MRTLHYTPQYFNNPTHPISITVIGCGGTGSLLLTRLARLDYGLKQLQMPGISVTCYDDDIVEPQNIGRQNFHPTDIGQQKAFCLVSKINNAFNLDWKAMPNRVNENNINTVLKSNIIITCVDNAETRHLIASKNVDQRNHYDYNTPFYWLDCGNGKDFGQVILSTFYPIEQPNENSNSELPSVIDLYGDLNQYDTEEQQGIVSCSFIDSILKQDLFINDEIALKSSKLLWKLLKNTAIDIHGYIINQSQGKTLPLLIK